ncbi:hypothetical protein UlMin_033499 [Ulmus minor]
MKDLSFFFLKNHFGAKMRKGIRTFCNGDSSTSTLDQHDNNTTNTKIPSSTCSNTLEEMIIRLELEEENARKAKLKDRAARIPSSSSPADILLSARNALNQYPRFSLDGKDAMYRSSFRNTETLNPGRRSVCCEYGLRQRFYAKRDEILETKFDKFLCLPSTFGGESVVWCKPGAVGRLMGLEAMPMPVSSNKEKPGRRQNLRRRAANGRGDADGYCVMKPVIAVETADHNARGRPLFT